MSTASKFCVEGTDGLSKHTCTLPAADELLKSVVFCVYFLFLCLFFPFLNIYKKIIGLIFTFSLSSLYFAVSLNLLNSYCTGKEILPFLHFYLLVLASLWKRFQNECFVFWCSYDLLHRPSSGLKSITLAPLLASKRQTSKLCILTDFWENTVVKCQELQILCRRTLIIRQYYCHSQNRQISHIAK